MPIRNPWKSYRQTATLTAPPGQVVLMLYDGALRFLERARAGFSHEDPAALNMAVNNNLQRAQEIIRELNYALNMEKGGELAATLNRLYDYFEHRIIESNFKKTPEGIEEVIRHLSVLRDAWATMLKNQDMTVPAQEAFVPAFATA
jgi:flagellar protein FliS